MLVNDFYTKMPLLVILVFVTSTGCLAEDKSNSSQVMEHVSRSILNATSEYSSRIEYCDQREAANLEPKLDLNVLSNLNVNRKQTVAALAFLHYRNYFLCEKEARLTLAFHLGTLASLKKELAVEDNVIDTIHETVSYPSQKEIVLELKYLALSKDVQAYFESTVGKEPFDLFATLEAYNLLM